MSAINGKLEGVGQWYNLENKIKSEIIYSNNFSSYLSLAEQYGWVPMGTVLNDEHAQLRASLHRINSPSWKYVFWFSTFDGEIGNSAVGLCWSSEKPLSSDEINNIKVSPHKYWDVETMTDNRIFGSFVQPYKCVQMNKTPPKIRLVQSAEEVRKKWDGSYLSDEGQTIMADDCKLFSEALLNAIDVNAVVDNDDLEEILIIIDLLKHGDLHITKAEPNFF